MLASTPLRVRAWARELLFISVLVLGLLSARWSLASHYFVPTGSMLPTVEVGDRVVVDKLAYGLRLPLTDVVVAELGDPERGDVIILDSPEDGTVLLKRVVGLPGDHIAVRGGRIELDGHPDPEDLPHASLAAGTGPDLEPTVVPPRRYLVMGDNRGASYDGRYFGWVERDAILGRVEGIFARGGELEWIDL